MTCFTRRLISAIVAKSAMITRLDSPEFHSLFTPELKRLSDLFASNGFTLRMAGGPVRDLLMGVSPADVDLATDATPDEMREMFTKENIRMFHKKGEEHGTISCRVNDKENFEITTLRIDVLCDGRRAAVRFTKNWEEDAFRRDLTINSLFLSLDGVIYDYTGGLDDIKTRRIAFVGDPIRRIQEDYLRILRYFRFFGRLAPLKAAHQPENIEAIIKCRDGLKDISGERIWMELNRIIVGRKAASVLRTMLIDCGLGTYLALNPEQIDEFEKVSNANAPKGEDASLNIEPSTALSALLHNIEDASRFQARCKCSNVERTLTELILQRRDEAYERENDLHYFKHLILDEIFDSGFEVSETIRRRYLELLKYIGAANSNIYTKIHEWNIDKFPVGGLDLFKLAVPKGPRMRYTLLHLFNLWKASDLQMSKDVLLEHVNDPEITILEKRCSLKKKKYKLKRRHSNDNNNGNS